MERRRTPHKKWEPNSELFDKAVRLVGGSTAELSRSIGRGPTTITQWKSKGEVPVWGLYAVKGFISERSPDFSSDEKDLTSFPEFTRKEIVELVALTATSKQFELMTKLAQLLPHFKE